MNTIHPGGVVVLPHLTRPSAKVEGDDWILHLDDIESDSYSERYTPG
jgi:hypothetical protein